MKINEKWLVTEFGRYKTNFVTILLQGLALIKQRFQGFCNNVTAFSHINSKKKK